MSPPLVTVVSFSTIELEFADDLLRNAAAFSDVVVLSVGERLYTGAPEDECAISALQQAHPAVRVVRYPVPDELLRTPIALHNRARVVGLEAGLRALRDTQRGDDGSWVLFLDGDEIPDGDKFAAWWRASRDTAPPSALKLLNYWLFLSPRLVAEEHEDSVLLVHSSCLTQPALDHARERDGIFMHVDACAAGMTRRRVPGLDGAPMFWHMSWVRRDRAALHRKVANWGHCNDRDWHTLIDAAMDGIERGALPLRDFVHGYPLRAVTPADAPPHIAMIPHANGNREAAAGGALCSVPHAPPAHLLRGG